jgi:hypothetical protein
MSHHLTQPEEIDIVLREELASSTHKIEWPPASKNNGSSEGWFASYVPSFKSDSLDNEQNLKPADYLK